MEKGGERTKEVKSLLTNFILAASVAHVQEAIEHIFPLLYDYRKERPVKVQEELVEEIVDSDDNITPDGRLKEESFWSDEDENGKPLDGTGGGLTRKRRLEGKATSSSSSKFPRKHGRYGKGKPFRRRRPLGKAANDPHEDVMVVSEDDPDDY